MKQATTQSKDYFREFVKERSKNARLSLDIIRMRDQYEREIATLKNALLNIDETRIGAGCKMSFSNLP
jgi:hypothetical protein